MKAPELIACPACDLIHRRVILPAGSAARCSRCSALLYRAKASTLDRPLALAVAGFLLLLIANFFPFLTLKLEGRIQDTVLISGILALYGESRMGVAALVLLTGLVFPLIQLAGLIYVLGPLKLGWQAPRMAPVYRWVRHIQPWAMTEIFMLGTLVSVVKLAKTGSIVTGPALYAFMALVLILPAAVTSVDAESVWQSTSVKVTT